MDDQEFDTAKPEGRDSRGITGRTLRTASLLLEGLDELGLHEAALYVPLACRRIRDQHPQLAMGAGDDSQPA